MKPSDTVLLVLSHWAFITGALAEALPLDSIPPQCATICGPIVELSSICSSQSIVATSPKQLLRNRRRHLPNDREGTTLKRQRQPAQRQEKPVVKAKRDFTVIVPAPTSFPSSLLMQECSTESQTETKITRIRPTPIFPTSKSPSSLPSSLPPPVNPLPPAASTPPPQSPVTIHPQPASSQKQPGTTIFPVIVTSESSTTASRPQSTTNADSDDDDDDDGSGNNVQTSSSDSTGTTMPSQDQGRWTMSNSEQGCVCDNKSFNVSLVAGLCSSCISIASQEQNDMDVIMNDCKFAPEIYTPDKDKVVINVRVQATPAKPVLGHNAGVTSASARAAVSISRPLVAVVAGLSLLHHRLLG